MIDHRSDGEGAAVVGTGTHIVRALFEAYRAQELPAAEALLAPDFRFTSPQDDHIGRDAYLRRCFPTAERFVSHRILDLVAVGDGDGDGDGSAGVFLRYEYELTSGDAYRNTEYLSVRDGQIIEVEVFFGGCVPGSALP